MNMNINKEASDQKYKRIERLTFLIIATIMGFGFLLAASWAFVAIFFPPEELIQEVEVGERTYRYTCQATYDASIKMFLYKCEGQNTDSCTLLKEASVVGFVCDNIVLRIQDNELLWELKGGAWTILRHPLD